MIENKEVEKILSKLETLEDDFLAVELLREFNKCSAELGKLLLNLDKNLNHEEWRNLCDDAQKKLNEIIARINNS